MKLSFSFLWLSLLLIVVFNSCTIEKRLYRGGYHVEWNKQLRSVDEAKTSTGNRTVEQTTSLAETNLETVTDIPSATENAKKTTEDLEQSTSISSNPVTNQSISQSVVKSQTHDYQTESLDESNNSTSVHKKNSQRDSSGGISRGLLVILIGLVFIGLGLIFNSALGTVIGSIMLLLFGLAGAIIIIVGLAMLIFRIA